MQHTSESDSPRRDPALAACLVRTRSAVLNVLVGVGATIAVGGWLLRGRAGAEWPAPPQRLHEVLFLALGVLAVASYVLRRVLVRRVALSEPGRRAWTFYWAHVLPAVIAALAAPLGIIAGWFVDARLEAVIPFWVVPLALGFNCVPRSHELDDFDRPTPDAGASSP